MSALPSRRSSPRLAVRLLALALTGVVAAGCSASYGGMGRAEDLLTSRKTLPPLKAPPPAGRVTVQMLPFTGVPVTTADDIYKRFRDLAAKEDVDLVDRLEDPATYRIQAHFVALGQDSATTVVFTYEIFDASGTRIHRIVGQDVAGEGDGDAWSGVDSEARARLADRGLRMIKAWLTRATP